MNWLRIHRHVSGSTRRAPARRHPVVEALEGRQLLSGIAGRHIGTSAMIVGNHIGTGAMIVGNHIGTGAMIVGNHIGTGAMVKGGHLGTSVANAAILFPVFAQ